jgi:transposase
VAVQDLPSTLPEAHALIAALRKEVEELQDVVRQQQLQIEELKRQLGRNSQNSSMPPSSDPPGAPKRQSKPPSGRKPGGQPGHEGHYRTLFPAERVDHVQDLWPDRCEKCHRELPKGAERQEAGDPAIHQVAELPRVTAEVTEFRRHAQCCPDCGCATRADLPPGVPGTTFGPRLHAAIAVLSVVYRVSKRSLQRLLAALFGIEISLGSIAACEQRTSAALAEPVAEAHEYIQTQPVANADETGWMERRRRAWLWVAVTTWVTVFMIHAKRGGEAARQLLGNFAGILGSDRWCAYARHLLKKRQLCWSHYLERSIIRSSRAYPFVGWPGRHPRSG